jgi:hypothetical protein
MCTKKNLIKSLIISIIILLPIGIVQASTYYVSPTGTATWAQCTNINTPCNVLTSFGNAVAGDTVYFRGGTYNVPAKNFLDTYRGYYEPANSGTAGSPITFAAYPSETPIFNGTAGGTGDVPDFATIFGTYGHSYIVFDGFKFKANSGTKMARILIGSDDSSNRSTNITIKNFDIDGGSEQISTQDNRETIRINNADDVLIHRCKLYNARSTNGYFGINGIKSYDANRVTVEYCEISNTEGAIYLKSSTDSWIVRYNWLHDNQIGIYVTPYVTASEHNANNHKIHNNVINKSSYSSIHIYCQDGATANNLEVYNNTIYNSSVSGELYGIFIGANTNFNASNSQTVHSNIILGTTYKLTFAKGTISECQYNQYGNSGSFTVRTNYGGGAVQFTSLTDWHNSTVVSGGQHPEGITTLNGLASNPLFQNGSGNYTQLSDFKLSSNSPSIGKGKNGSDMGAKISLVGVGGGNVPNAPGSLTIK